MKLIPYQLVIAFGVFLLVVKLLIDLLIPIGLVLVILGIILYFYQQSDTAKVVKK
jgi:hypothetical protein